MNTEKNNIKDNETQVRKNAQEEHGQPVKKKFFAFH